MAFINKPLISIIIPVYNAERYLKRCVDSVLNQSFKDLELILVNDGSTDGSDEICDFYSKQDERVQVYHLKNGGPSHARNHGMIHAVGKYITFIDADDYINDYFSETANKVIIHDYDLIVVPFTIVNKNQEAIQLHHYKEKSFLRNEKKEDFLRGIWLGEPLFGSCGNKWFKLTIVQKNELSFNNNFYIAEDYLFNLHFYRESQSGILFNFPYYNYVQYENSLTSRVFYNRFEIAKTVYEESLKLLKDLNIHDASSRNFVEESYLSGVLRAMFEIAKKENKLSLKQKIMELKKYISDKEVRTVLSSKNRYKFNRLAFYCLKYQWPIIYYTVFKLRYLMKGWLYE
ncbi:glycosyltransferase family 2 protein [Bacillus sp. EAC]|uniref:glycosyltransferase family 2 protein n=1 Tax=Bacillus sp. EAC TaxID=1978338 RepID=UPI000B451971|nr:glycosyltransferase family 2 protein [Bacillus sp. EAC]